MEKLRESDLYGPVRDYLAGLGYEVKGEVKDCDVTAMRDGELIVVELKKGFTLELVYQALDRQRVADGGIAFGDQRPVRCGHSIRVCGVVDAQRGEFIEVVGVGMGQVVQFGIMVDSIHLPVQPGGDGGCARHRNGGHTLVGAGQHERAHGRSIGLPRIQACFQCHGFLRVLVQRLVRAVQDEPPHHGGSRQGVHIDHK